jgi:hypothetical protein
MSRFLKLTKSIINTNQIRIIDFNKPSEYAIHLVTKEFYGSVFLGTGNIYSSEPYFIICEKKNPEDYKIVSDWIKNV